MTVTVTVTTAATAAPVSRTQGKGGQHGGIDMERTFSSRHLGIVLISQQVGWYLPGASKLTEEEGKASPNLSVDSQKLDRRKEKGPLCAAVIYTHNPFTKYINSGSRCLKN